jgi:hypothetical protein
MSIRKTVAGTLAALTLATTLALASGEAQAGSRFGTGLAIGIAAGALFAAGAYGSGHYIEPSYRCRWVNHYDAYGYFVRKVRVCHSY